jgi:hypothetical protein
LAPHFFTVKSASLISPKKSPPPPPRILNFFQGSVVDTRGVPLSSKRSSTELAIFSDRFRGRGARAKLARNCTCATGYESTAEPFSCAACAPGNA